VSGFPTGIAKAPGSNASPGVVGKKIILNIDKLLGLRRVFLL